MYSWYFVEISEITRIIHRKYCADREETDVQLKLLMVDVASSIEEWFQTTVWVN